jgi:hypothetical protein
MPIFGAAGRKRPSFPQIKAFFPLVLALRFNKVMNPNLPPTNHPKPEGKDGCLVS